MSTNLSAAVVGEGKVFVTADGEQPRHVRLIALKARTGRVLWTRDLGPHGFAAAAYGDGRVFVTRATVAEPGGLIAVSAADGSLLWESRLRAQLG